MFLKYTKRKDKLNRELTARSLKCKKHVGRWEASLLSQLWIENFYHDFVLGLCCGSKVSRSLGS